MYIYIYTYTQYIYSVVLSPYLLTYHNMPHYQLNFQHKFSIIFIDVARDQPVMLAYF